MDVCRGLGILLVLYGHALEATFPEQASLADTQFFQWQFIYTFHMPLFFFISGWVFRKKPLAAVLGTGLYLVLIALATHLVGSALQGMDQPFDARQVLQPLVAWDHFSVVVTWYLVALAFVNLLFHALQGSSRARQLSIWAGLVVLQVIAWKTHTRYFQVQTWLPGLLFYALGQWFSQRGRAAAVQGWLRGSRVWLLPLGLALALAVAPLNGGCTLVPMKVCADFRGQFGVMFAIGRYGFLPAFLVSALLGIALTVALALVISRLRWAAASRGLAFIGQRTLELLVLNGFVLVFLQPALTRAFQIQSGPLETLAWTSGLVAGQLVLLPLWRRLVEPLFGACRWAADRLLALSTSLKSL